MNLKKWIFNMLQINEKQTNKQTNMLQDKWSY